MRETHGEALRALVSAYAAQGREHPWVLGCVLASLGWTLWDLGQRGALANGLALCALYAAAVLLTDVSVRPRTTALPERRRVLRPALETSLLVAWTAFLVTWLSWKMLWPEALPAVGAVLLKGPGVLVVLAVLLSPLGILVAHGYRAADFGIRAHGLRLGVRVVLLFAATALMLNPEGILWRRAFERQGLLGVCALLGSGLMAGVSEELFRTLLQTRAGALTGNAALGWFIASAAWAGLHMPIFMAKFDDPLRWISLIPLGLVWGYMTHRTRSATPAILVHSTNLWGIS